MQQLQQAQALQQSLKPAQQPLLTLPEGGMPNFPVQPGMQMPIPIASVQQYLEEPSADNDGLEGEFEGSGGAGVAGEPSEERKGGEPKKRGRKPKSHNQ